LIKVIALNLLVIPPFLIKDSPMEFSNIREIWTHEGVCSSVILSVVQLYSIIFLIH